ncbi:hypothetical protein, partial [Zavarzinella formosa]|uniref:hypothetical protein n=1 Tax=Zavarzinella formosa TaxID=360055 RepID=UPI001EE675A4
DGEPSEVVAAGRRNRAGEPAEDVRSAQGGQPVGDVQSVRVGRQGVQSVRSGRQTPEWVKWLGGGEPVRAFAALRRDRRRA